MNLNPAQQQLSPCDVAALEKCLKESKGDTKKCVEEINAFQRACGKAKSSDPQQAQQQAPQQQQQ